MQFDTIGQGSVVFDIGGFQGNWAADIHARYGARIHVFEPHPGFAEEIRNRFRGNNAILTHEFALGANEGELILSDDGDACQDASSLCPSSSPNTTSRAST